MNEQKNTPPSSSMILRVLGGGYLVYLAWDIRGAIPDGPLYVIPIILFAVIGAALAGHSLWTLARHGYFRKSNETDSTEELEDESDE